MLTKHQQNDSFFPSDLIKLNEWVLFIVLLYTASTKFISVENFTSVNVCSKEYLLRFSSSTPKVSYTWFLKFPLLQIIHTSLSLFTRKRGIHKLVKLHTVTFKASEYCLPFFLSWWLRPFPSSKDSWSTLLSRRCGKRIEGWGCGRRGWVAGPLASALLRSFVSQGNCIRVWTKTFSEKWLSLLSSFLDQLCQISAENKSFLLFTGRVFLLLFLELVYFLCLAPPYHKERSLIHWVASICLIYSFSKHSLRTLCVLRPQLVLQN